MKQVPVLALFLALSLLLAGCTSSSTQPTSGKLVVVASFFPLYDFARNVGGDRVEVTMLIPPGVDPHEFELSPSDAMKLGNARIFLYNGAGMEPWVPQLLQGVENNNLTAVDTSKGMDFIVSKDADKPGNDPHVWLDPLLAKKQVMAIRDAFIEADPAGKDYYNENAADYMAKLDALDAEFRTAMASCKKRDVLIAHATVGYFCKEYGCNQIPIEGINPEAEPLPADIASIVTQAKEHNVTTVFVEKLVSPKAAQTIADEINGTTVNFNSVHGITLDEMSRNETYLSLMHENVQIIKTALECN
jgi:zinc transport system substrate-binding protein